MPGKTRKPCSSAIEGCHTVHFVFSYRSFGGSLWQLAVLADRSAVDPVALCRHLSTALPLTASSKVVSLLAQYAAVGRSLLFRIGIRSIWLTVNSAYLLHHSRARNCRFTFRSPYKSALCPLIRRRRRRREVPEEPQGPGPKGQLGELTWRTTGSPWRPWPQCLRRRTQLLRLDDAIGCAGSPSPDSD